MFTEREKVALRYADAITWDPTQADDALWAQLTQHFTEPELVELGFLVGVLCGTAMFANEQMEGAYKFLGSQRLPLGRFWLMKLSWWLAVAVGIALLMLFTGAIWLGTRDQERWSILYSGRNAGREFVFRLFGDSASVRATGAGSRMRLPSSSARRPLRAPAAGTQPSPASSMGLHSRGSGSMSEQPRAMR